MTLQRPIFVRKDAVQGTGPLAARLALAGLIAGPDLGVRAGILRGLDVTGMVDWNYSVSPGHLVTRKSAADGAALWAVDAATTVATSAAPGSGSRIDIIYAAHNDIDALDADSAPVIAVAQGAASGTPSAPSIPAGAIELRRCTIPSGATGTQGGTFSNVGRTGTAAHGDYIPVWTTEQRDAITWGSQTNPARARGVGSGTEWVNTGSGWVSNGGWEDYTPTLTGITLGTTGAVLLGRYERVGSTVKGWVYVKFGTGGAGSGQFTIGVPVTANYPGQFISCGTWFGSDDSSGTGRVDGTAALVTSTGIRMTLTGIANWVGTTTPFTWAANDWFSISFEYEAA